MHDDYADIRDRIDEEPTWYDRHGVPRFCPATPENRSDIYAKQVLFLDVACQSCGRRFLVEMTWNGYNKTTPFDERIAAGHVPHYGDPPAHARYVDDCAAGDTMNVDLVRVVALWRRGKMPGSWERVEIEPPEEDSSDACNPRKERV